VRHVRMLGLCLVAMFALSAMVAVPALAKNNKVSVHTWTQYKYCPYDESPPPQSETPLVCFYGETSGGPGGGFFSVGDVKVPLSKPVILQGALYGDEAAPGHEEGGFFVVPATNGGETLESPELKVEKGLKLITKQDEREAGWPEALVESFNEAKKNKETGLKVKIEVAGNALYESPNSLNIEHLVDARDAAFELPLKTRLISPWLEKLGGGPCTVGNNEHPIWQYLTTEAPGYPGYVEFNPEFTQIELLSTTLVALNWPVEEAAGATGCGGEYESYVDAAISSTLGLKYHALGTTALTGRLFDAETQYVRQEAEAGHV
jgi:hypothetical protein